MKHLNTNPYFTHDEISLLLPWYVNKTLREEELSAVESHLKICLVCKRELASLEKLSIAINQESSFDSEANVSFAHLMNKIHTATRPDSPLPQLHAIRKSMWRSNVLRLPALHRPKAALAAAILLALVIPNYFDLVKLPSNDYRTLSDSEQSKPRNNDIRLVFSKDVTKQQIDAIVSSVQGQLVGQPTEQSVYTVHIEHAKSSNDILNTLAELRKNPKIIFAEPAYTLLSANHNDRGIKL